MAHDGKSPGGKSPEGLGGLGPRRISDLIRLHVIVAVWGFTAILGKLIQLPAVEMVFLRSLISAVTLGVWFAISHRWSKRSVPASADASVAPVKRKRVWPDRKNALGLLSVGALIGVHWVMLFAAVNLSNVSVATVGLMTLSLWTAITEPLLLAGRRAQVHQFVFGGVILLAVMMIFGTQTQDMGLGFAMGMGAAALAAVFSVLNAKFTGRYGPDVITAYQMVGSTAICGLALLAAAASVAMGGGVSWLVEPAKPLRMPDAYDWFYLAVLAVVCTVYAYVEFVELLKRLTVFTILFANNLEPLYSIAMGAVLFSDYEQVNASFYGGAAIIIAAVVAQTLWSRRRREPG